MLTRSQWTEKRGQRDTTSGDYFFKMFGSEKKERDMSLVGGIEAERLKMLIQLFIQVIQYTKRGLGTNEKEIERKRQYTRRGILMNFRYSASNKSKKECSRSALFRFRYKDPRINRDQFIRLVMISGRSKSPLRSFHCTARGIPYCTVCLILKAGRAALPMGKWWIQKCQ